MEFKCNQSLLGSPTTWQRFADAGPLAMAERFGWDRAAEVTGRAYLRASSGSRS